MRSWLSSFLYLFVAHFLFPDAKTNHASHISFIENRGQWGDFIRYKADIPGGIFLILNDGVMFQFFEAKENNKKHFDKAQHVSSDHQLSIPLTVKFDNPKDGFTISTLKEKKTSYNYYHGLDNKYWASGCKAFESIVFNDVYEGIDVLFYSVGSILKYDVMVREGADASLFKLNYFGDFDMALSDGCNLITRGDVMIEEGRPYAYQQVSDGTFNKVQCEYRLENHQLSFNLGTDYNKNIPLVIDPELIFSTFSGAVSDNFGYTATFDEDGNHYNGGIIFGNNFNATTNTFFSGGTDIVIQKFDTTGGQLLYATFIGGSSEEAPNSLVVNSMGELVILGSTGSSNFPTTNGAFDRSFGGGSSFTIFNAYQNGSDITLCKLNDNGELLKSTYLGGSQNDGILKLTTLQNYQNALIRNYGDFHRGDVIVDAFDNIYVASNTESNDFPIKSTLQKRFGGGISDAVFFSLDTDLSTLRYSTYLGGSSDDAAYSIKLTNRQQILLGGGTSSVDFPSTNRAIHSNQHGAIDGFVTIVDMNGDSIVASTFLGTNSYDQVYFVDTDEFGNIYAFGQTTGKYPVTQGVYTNPNSAQFIHKTNEELEITLFSTVFGSGSLLPNISPTAFLVNDCGNIFLSGWGGGTNNRGGISNGTTLGLPITSDAFFPQTNGNSFYFMVLSDDAAELLYATYFGSTNSIGDHVDGGTSRFDKRGIIYQTVCSCGGSSDDFPTTEGAWSRTNNGVNSMGQERCNSIAVKMDLASLEARFITNDITRKRPGITEGCSPFTVLFTNTSIGGETFTWDFGDATGSFEKDSVIHTFTVPGTYDVLLTAVDDKTCQRTDMYVRQIRVYEDQVSVNEPPPPICEGTTTQLVATGGTSYRWTPAISLSDTAVANPLASPSTTTVYTVIINTPNGCIEERSVEVEVISQIRQNFEVSRVHSCESNRIFDFVNYTEYSGEMIFDLGDGTLVEKQSFTHTYKENGIYEVNLRMDERCIEKQELSLEAKDFFIPNVFTPNGDGVNDFFELDIDQPFALEIVHRNGTKIFSSETYNNDWDGGNYPAGVYYFLLTFDSQETCKGWVHIIK